MAKDQLVSIVFENRAATIANIFAADKEMQKGVRKAVKENGAYCQKLAVDLAPASAPGDYDGAGELRLKRSIELAFSEDFLTWNVFSNENLFAEDGQPYYAPIVESRQPYLKPAWDEFFPATQRAISREIKAAIRRRSIAVKTQNV